MTPTFGFSAGDFVAAIQLITKVTKTLRDSGGAAQEYQAVSQELTALVNILEQLGSLNPTDSNAGYVNAVRDLTLSCKPHLETFLEKIAKFERSLNVKATRGALVRTTRKAQWAIFLGAEIPPLRSLVAAKVLGVQLLLEANNL